MKEHVNKIKLMGFEQGGDGVLRYQGRLCVQMVDGLEGKIMKEGPSSTKMYHDLREVYWWSGMNKALWIFFYAPKFPTS